MMNRVQRLPDWLRFRSRQAAVLTALVTCLLLAPWVAEAQSNSAPVFTEGASATRSFNETLGNAAVATGSNIGMAVDATDMDAGDTLTYTLEGTDASRFDIISTSGQLRTQAGEKYDYEAKSSYQVTVRVEDSSGGSDTITVTLDVTDQDEPPPAPTLDMFGTADGGGIICLKVWFYPPGNRGRPAITNYEVRYRVGYSGDWVYVPWQLKYLDDSRFQAESGELPHPKSESIYNYYAQVRAINDEGEGTWSMAGGLSTDWELDTPPNNLPRGAPTISGAAQVGGMLTADTSGIADLDGLTNVSYEYQWIASDGNSDVEIANATASTYTVAAEDVDRTIRVRVTFTDDADHQETLTSEATEAVDFAVQPQRANTPATGTLTISGTAQVGQTLTAITSGIADADGLVNASFDYQWERQVLATDAVTDIPGATGATYEVTSDDRDSAVRVSVSFSDDAENSETLTSYWLLTQAPANNLATGVPKISGTAQVGKELTADTSSIADADGLTNVSYEYQWIASNGSSDVEIANATAPTYTVADDDVGWTIQVRVTFTDDADHQETLTSDATGAVDFAVQLQRANTPATGALTISGTAEVGTTLTAITSAIADADGLVNASFDYQWERQVLATGSVTDIPGATGASYKVTSDDRDSAVRVSVSFSDDAENSETLSSYWTAVLTPPNNLATGAPTISGTAQVGETLTADTSSIVDADGLTNASFSYQWIASNGRSDVEIANATAPTYTVGVEVEGWTIQVRVTFTDDADHEQSLTSAATALAQPPAPDGPPDTPNRPNATAVFVGGVDLEWNEVPGADSYDVQQYRGGGWTGLPADGVEIAFYGAGAIISGLDPESSLWFRVRAANGHGVSDWSAMLYMNSTSQFKLGRKARPDNEPASGAPVVHGTAQVGESLWADATGIGDGNGLDRVQFQYQWTSNYGSADTDIAGATDSGYTLVADDVGRTIRVRVAFTDRGGYSETRTSVATGAVAAAPNNPATGAPTISGMAEVGETLTADTSGIADADGLVNATYSYQWLSDDAEIGGATGSTYTLLASDEGQTIKVRVIVTDDAGNETTLTSSATDEVGFAVQQQGASNTPATGAPTISGTAQVGEELTADTTGITDTDGLTNAVFAYQWLSDDAEIGGATDSTYTLVYDDEGQTIKVRVIVTDDAENETTLTSEATDAVEAAAQPDSPATGQPTISGMARVGEMLTADTSGIADDDGLTNAVFAYQWLSDDAEIGGATDSTYTLVDDDEGQTIKVRVIVTDDAENETTLTSAATEAVAAAAQPDSPATGQPTISGTAQVGEELTADTSGITDTDGLTNAAFAYQWLSDDAEIGGATDSTYTLVDDDEGQTIKVRVTVTDDAENETTLTSAATAVVASPEPPAKPTGLSAAVSHDTVTLTWDNPQDDAITGYVILRRDREIHLVGTFITITGDTGSADTTYPDDTVEPDKQYVYRIKAINEHGEVSEESDWIRADTPAVPVPDKPTGLSAAVSHDTVTLTWDNPQDDAITGYVILRRDREIHPEGTFVTITGDTGSAETTYTDDTVEPNKQYVYRIKAINEHGKVSERSHWVRGFTPAAPQPDSPATGRPTISGTAQVGEELTADTSGIADTDGLTNAAFAYQWLSDDAEIGGATDSTYTLVYDDEGQTIKVRVTVTDDAENETTLTSAATEAVAAAPQPDSPATGQPTISGTARVGEMLTADTSGIADADGLDNATYSYQWLYDDTDIAGATSSTYTLVDGDEGQTIKVRVIVTDDLGNETTLTSAATEAVAAKRNTAATGRPTISGTVRVGEMLTADTSGIADDDGLTNVSYSYQWVVTDGGAYIDISGETGSTYTLVSADRGLHILVRVSFTDDAGKREKLASAETEVVAAAA